MSPAPLFRRMAVVPVDGRQVVLSYHAVSRWLERLRPDLELPAAISKLATAVADHGAIARRRPNGVDPSSKVHAMLSTVAWLVVDGAAFPLTERGDELVAMTCLLRRENRR